MAHQFYFNPYILDNLPAPAKGFDVVQDISEPRLRMYITSRGVKTFFVRKRVRGKDKRILIGKYPDVDIEYARSAVPCILENVVKKPPVRRKKITFKQFLDLYLVNKVRRGEDSHMKLERAINRHLKGLFDKKISEIKSEDVRSCVKNIRGAAIAARMQELLQSVFNYALEMGYVKSNPVAGLEKIKQNRRVRPLNRAGLQRLISVSVILSILFLIPMTFRIMQAIPLMSARFASRASRLMHWSTASVIPSSEISTARKNSLPFFLTLHMAFIILMDNKFKYRENPQNGGIF